MYTPTMCLSALVALRIGGHAVRRLGGLPGVLGGALRSGGQRRAAALRPAELAWLRLKQMWLWVKTNGIPFRGRCTTHFSPYFSGD